MKRQQLYFLIGAALVLAIAGTIFQLVRSAGWKGEATDLEPFAKLPVNSVEKLVIKSSKDKVTLQKASDIWTVAERNGYPADFSKIRELITSLWEFKVVRQLDVGPSQFGRLNIVAPGQGDHSGVELDLNDASGKSIKSLIFGKTFGGENSSGADEEDGPSGSGRFVYDPSEKDKVYLSKENFYTVDASPKNWLDKDFIRAEGVKEVERPSSSNGDGWKVSKKDEKAAWELVDAKPGETLNTSAVASLGAFSPNFEDVKPANTPDSETGLNKAVTVNLETFDGFKYTLEIGGEAPEQSRFFRFKVSADLPAKRTAEPNESPDDKKKKDDVFNKQQETLKTRLAAEQKLQNWIFEVESYSLETFLKSRKDILKQASPTPAPKPAVNTGVLPKSAVPLPLAATPTPAVSPAPVVPSPSPETSATPEATAPLQTTPTPETTRTPETTPSPEVTPTPETTPSPEGTPSPEASSSPEAVPTSSPSPSATPGT
ncbi:MAG: DUF4340 domain-containing protein [Verrucomicrobia bacterium]|nr:DUF4340 domain-containing protein [Verrucomicrobiota bacterium]MBV8485406.1 DUF4340 domain-containing protein [Verrucomicrobiota bacterium]